MFECQYKAVKYNSTTSHSLMTKLNHFITASAQTDRQLEPLGGLRPKVSDVKYVQKHGFESVCAVVESKWFESLNVTRLLEVYIFCKGLAADKML